MKNLFLSFLLIFLFTFLLFAQEELVCPNGHPIKVKGAKFCTICGAKLIPVSQTKPKEEAQPQEQIKKEEVLKQEEVKETIIKKEEEPKQETKEPLKELLNELKENKRPAVSEQIIKDTTTVSAQSQIVEKKEEKQIQDKRINKSEVSEEDIGYKYFVEQNYSKALETYLSNLKEKENDFLINYNIGVCYFKLNQLQDAEAYLKKSLKLNVNNPEVYIYLGLVNYKLNKKDEAKSYFRKVLLLDVDEKYIELSYKYLKMLDNL
ncbi:MAG TPA: tetratricopeptide repeat protein [bacterium]|nr:tetratricopeptide repeat protein [bacterium]HOL48538.1 tetratricopeptide repeat protein [bacterium]HPQ19926.1 tetratricopeptide repeat protein [bacterium]